MLQKILEDDGSDFSKGKWLLAGLGIYCIFYILPNKGHGCRWAGKILGQKKMGSGRRKKTPKVMEGSEYISLAAAYPCAPVRVILTFGH